MLSMKAKYALRALMVLARNEKKTLQIKSIAKDADAPPKFLESIMLELKNRGLVGSKRGIFGGYYLTRPASEITMGAIIRIIDGPLAPIRCASLTAYQKCEDCTDEVRCEIRKAMVEVRHAIAGVLDNRSIVDLLQSSGNGVL